MGALVMINVKKIQEQLRALHFAPVCIVYAFILVHDGNEPVHIKTIHTIVFLEYHLHVSSLSGETEWKKRKGTRWWLEAYTMTSKMVL